VARDGPNECFGHGTADQLRQLLPASRPIRIEREVESRDHYDKLLASAYAAADELFVNQALVAGGYTEAKEFPPNTTSTTSSKRPKLPPDRQKSAPVVPAKGPTWRS
jgi:endonuclease YncB( thermonuclease family)